MELKKPLGGVLGRRLRLGSDGWGQPVIPERGLCFSKALLRAVGSIRIWSGKCPHTASDFRPPSATNVALQYPTHPSPHKTLSSRPSSKQPNFPIIHPNFLSLIYRNFIICIENRFSKISLVSFADAPPRLIQWEVAIGKDEDISDDDQSGHL